MEAFAAWLADPLTPSILVQRVAEGETLRAMCKSLGLPYSQVARHIAGTPALKMEYDAALQLWADALAQETVGLADGVAGADEASHVSAAKLAVETRLKLAGKWDRDRYGEREGPRVSVNINLGDVTREIRELESRLGIGVATLEVVPELAAPIPEENIEEGII